MQRILASVLSVNILLGLLGFAFVWWRSQDPSVVDALAMGGSSDAAVQELLLADAARAGMAWWSLVILGTAATALLWLVLAWRRQPSGPQQARAAGGSWWLLLLLALMVAVIAGYRVYVNEGVAQAWRMTLAAGGLLIVPLAYWLSTALGVKASMSPSVPMASLVRR